MYQYFSRSFKLYFSTELKFDVVKPEGQKDMGKIMKEATAKLKGKADMKEVSNIIREKLNS